MRSTRRTDALVTAVVLGGLGTALAFVIGSAPPEPRAPRFEGAGHDAPVRGGTFVFHHTTNVRSLDPHVAFNELSTLAIRLMFDGLLEYDEHTELVPSLARSMPEVSEDGLTFRFELRRGVRFQNGRELTAEDVRWSMERMLSPDLPSPGPTYYSQLVGLEDYRERRAEHVRGIRVLDRHTIEFTLGEPDQSFLHAMAMAFAYPVPREHYEGLSPEEAATRPLGPGPFSLERWERGVRLELRRNPDYWQPGKPYVERMIYLENLTRHVAVMRFRNGDIDAVHRFSPADYLFFKGSEAWQPYLLHDAKVNIWGVAMNTEMAPFDDVHFRRAVAYAMDREGWSRARNGRLRVTGQPIPPGLLGYDAEMPEQQRYDLARAREEMALAGYAEGYPDELTLWNTASDTGRFYAAMVGEDLAQIGIHVRNNAVSFSSYLEETGKPHTAQMLLAGWNMDFPDPSNFMDSLFHSGSARESHSTNRAFYRNPDLDRVIDRARVEPDRARRGEMYREASRILARDAPWAFMWNDAAMEAVQPYVRGYFVNRVFAEDYRFVWLDLPRHRVAHRALARRGIPAALFPFGLP